VEGIVEAPCGIMVRRSLFVLFLRSAQLILESSGVLTVHDINEVDAMLKCVGIFAGSVLSTGEGGSADGWRSGGAAEGLPVTSLSCPLPLRKTPKEPNPLHCKEKEKTTQAVKTTPHIN